jgi:hypothetical protein
MQMSITRALSELKLLNSRIEHSVNNPFIIHYKKSAKKVDNINTPDEFSEKAKANYQSVTDLIARRKIIKAAIVASNAITDVQIGTKTMKVAEVIERKESIKYDQMLLNSMESQYRTSLALTNKQNEVVQSNLDSIILTTYGKDAKQNDNKKDEIAVITKGYLEQNEYIVLDALKLGDKIEALKKDIEEFIMNCDFSLSESNTLTKIEIPD